ncbi:MAG: hypothetical protein AAF715_29360 [Myxococcota bacterium]
MTVDELGLALAIYCEGQNGDVRTARRHLDPTPQACFDEATAWVKSNAKVVRLLAEDPDAIAARSYSLSPARGWLSRVLGIGRPKGVSAPDDAELASVMRDIEKKRAERPPSRRRERERLRALVDDAFDGP